MKKPKRIFKAAACRVKFFLAGFLVCLSFGAAALGLWLYFLGAKIKAKGRRRKRAQSRLGETNFRQS